MNRCDGIWENNDLCMVYPKEYTGTENERKLMQVLEEAAESYCEENRVYAGNPLSDSLLFLCKGPHVEFSCFAACGPRGE